MICLSLQKLNFRGLSQAVSKSEMAEIRLDLTPLTNEEIAKIFAKKHSLIATCRLENLPQEECYDKLMCAMGGNGPGINAGFRKYIDIESDSPRYYRDRLIKEAKSNNFEVILSYHNFNNCDSFDKLLEIAQNAFSDGADIVKIVTTANVTEDGVRTLKLYNHFSPEKLLAFSMGKSGRFTRLLSLNFGAPFIYAAPELALATADGQLTPAEIEKVINKDNYKNRVNFKSLHPLIKAPTSKSHAQRAIIAAGLSRGESNIYGFTPCDDTTAAIEMVKSFGVEVQYEQEMGHLTIKSAGADAIRNEFEKETTPLEFNAGESGLLSKLTIPIAGHLSSSREITITGVNTLLNREYKDVDDVLKKVGLHFVSKNNYLPAKITGEIKGGNVSLSGKGGSQLLSGLLMALPLCTESSKIELEHATSKPYIDLTLKTLKDFNVKINNVNYTQFQIPGRQRYRKKIFYQIQGDWSSAALLLVGAAISNPVVVRNLSINTSQADERILEVLNMAGVEMVVNEGPKYLIMCGDLPCAFKDNPEDETCCSGNVNIKSVKLPLKAFEFDATDSPDLFPPLVVLALNCEGVSRIKGVCRLYNKESNRAEALYSEFTKLGARIDIDGDYMIVKGGPLTGGYCNTYGDHRIAMALTIAGLNIGSPLYIDNIECISKSYPNFIKNFEV